MMDLNPVRRLLGVKLKPQFFAPVMKGPPGNPEYFMLLHRPGQWPKHDWTSKHFVPATEDEMRLFTLRRQRYGELFPGFLDSNPGSRFGFRYPNARLDPDHMPKSMLLKKKVILDEYLMPGLSLDHDPAKRFSDAFLLVRKEMKDAIQSLDSDLCQFFPFSFRLKTGEVTEEFFIMHVPNRPTADIVMEKSGATKQFRDREVMKNGLPEAYWTPPSEDIIRKGLLVIKRPSAPEKPLYFCDRWMIFSRALAEKIRPQIPKVDDLYPVHVDGDA